MRDGRPSTLPRLDGPEVNALGRALEEMRDAIEGKDYVENYVQALTHQIKAPLSAVRGAAELLQETSMPPEDRLRFLANIGTETERIQRIIDRLLQLAALEKRKGLESTERIDLHHLARAVVDELQPVLAPRTLTARVEGASGIVVTGERFLLREALLNLLHNAVDFSPEGGEIVATVSARDGRATIDVLDQGPGVPGFALLRVFERFYSLPRPGTTAKSTGLGLSFVREIAHLHGGEVTLENRSDHGGAKATIHLASSFSRTNTPA